MITGQVVAGREAVIPLTLQGTQGQMTTFDALVDTGFTGFLTLPLSQIAQLGFSYEGIIDARLGDGRAASLICLRVLCCGTATSAQVLCLPLKALRWWGWPCSKVRG